jgi:hypothetical protein
MEIRYEMNVGDRLGAGKIHFRRPVIHYLVVLGPVPAKRI